MSNGLSAASASFVAFTITITRISPPYMDISWEPVNGLYQYVEWGELISTRSKTVADAPGVESPHRCEPFS
jgi:hypothetical protein